MRPLHDDPVIIRKDDADTVHWRLRAGHEPEVWDGSKWVSQPKKPTVQPDGSGSQQ